MTYKRDPRVKFTDMCIYIDENIYKDTFDEQKCYEYMYHIFYTLAVKDRFFNSAEDYDKYSLFAATRLYLRYRKKHLAVIKSVLNYAKKILYPTRVEYQDQSFNQIFNPVDDKEVTEHLQNKLHSAAVSQNDNLMRVEFRYYLKKIPRTIKAFLSESPYTTVPNVFHNIYLSCLLSILNSFTMSRDNIKRLNNKLSRGLPTDNLIEKIYNEERQSSIILYNLPQNMYNYISTLVNKIYNLLRKDLVYILGSYEPSDAIVQSILSSPVEDPREDQE